MSESYQYFNDSGVIIADVADIKSGIQTEWQDAIGQDLVLDDSTPQGQLIDGETLARANVMRLNAQIANQINPNIAGGVWLDALCSWLGIYRQKATATLITGCVLKGQAGTQVAAGSRAKTTSGYIATCQSTVTIGDDGTVTADFALVDTGEITVPAGALSRIVDSVLGWESINNPTAGITGTEQQSDSSLRTVRGQRLASNAISSPEAIISGLYGVEGVRSLQFRENVDDETQTIDGIEMVPHSVWVCVYGGDSQSIAEVLLREKTCGAGWNGQQEVTVTNGASGQPYTVKFDRATAVPVTIRVTVAASTVTGNSENTVRDSLLAYANGEIDGEAGFVVGGDVSPYELSGAINIQHPETTVLLVELSRKGSSLSTDVLELSANEVPTLSANDISVVIQ